MTCLMHSLSSAREGGREGKANIRMEPRSRERENKKITSEWSLEALILCGSGHQMAVPSVDRAIRWPDLEAPP